MFCSRCIWGKRNRASSVVSVTPSESSNKMMPEGKTKSTTLTPSGEKSPHSTPSDEISTSSASSDEISTTSAASDGKSVALTLPFVTDKHVLPGRTDRRMLLTSVLTGVSGQASLRSPMRLTATAERKNATLNGQEKKTTAKKTRPDMKKNKTTTASVKQSFKLLMTKHGNVEEADLKIASKNTAMSKVKEEKKQTTPFYRRRKIENPKQERKELTFFSDVRKWRSMKDPFTFRSNIMMFGKNTKNTTLTPSNGKCPGPASLDKKFPALAPSVGKSPTPALTKGNTKRPALAPSVKNSTTRKQVLPGENDEWHDFINLLLINASLQCQLSDEDCCEDLLDLPELSHLPDNSSENIEDTFPGLPNFGNSCYINASLQCLFTAEAFCKELSYLLDDSGQNIEDTFLICFVELSRLRRGFEIRGDKDSFLLALIDSAADLNPEFTIYEQNDPHEFLCHCLTQMEETGQWQGWQEDVNPRCPVKTNFSFKMRNTVTCSSCGSQQSNKVDVFNYMFVPLVHNSVDQCLYHRLNKTTKLESKCKVCGGELASSRWTFHTLPRFLILQLNRFKATEHYSVKLKTPVNIQPKLQIDYLPQTNMLGTENNTAEARETGRNEPGKPIPTYQLISVLSHFGVSPKYGHYVTDCFSHKYHEWTTYDDQVVTPTTEMDVLQMRSSDAYVLLYEIVSTKT